MKRIVVLLIFVAIAFPAVGHSQWAVTPAIAISIPTSDFSNVSGVGGGLVLRGVRNIKSLGGFGVRGDFAFLSHGKEFQSVIISGLSFPAEVRNESFRLGVGGQYTVGSETFKVYGSGMGGFYWFRTNINVNSSAGFFQAQGSSDAAWGWSIGGGFQYDIGLGPLLDLGLTYQIISGVTTQFEVTDETGAVVGTREASITANEFTVMAGVTFYLGKK